MGLFIQDMGLLIQDMGLLIWDRYRVIGDRGMPIGDQGMVIWDTRTQCQAQTRGTRANWAVDTPNGGCLKRLNATDTRTSSDVAEAVW